MPVNLTIQPDLLYLRLEGNLSVEEFARSFPKIQAATKAQRDSRVLVDLTRFEGWDMTGRWEDVRFDKTRLSEVSRLAFVGELDWARWMKGFSRPFNRAKIEYFTGEEGEQAREWLTESPA